MRSLWLLLVALALVPNLAYPQSFGDDVRPLLRESCVRCHGVRTVTPLNLVDLGDDLTDHETFQAWEKVYDRLSRGEMPPAAAPPAASLIVPPLWELTTRSVAAPSPSATV